MVEETKTSIKKRLAKKKTAKKRVARKKTAVKKVAPKKELTTEEQFEVEVAKDSAGFSDTDTSTVTASDTADAIQQMDKQHPEGYDAVSIKKKGSGSKEPATAPVAAEPIKAVSKTTVEDKKEEPKKKSRRMVDVNTFELTEDYDSGEFNFPYSIVLPIGYENFVTMAAGKSSHSIMIIEHRGRLKTTLESAEAMDDFVESLVEMAKGDEHKDKATMLIKGIMGSLRRR